jgi:hypothetical protein
MAMREYIVTYEPGAAFVVTASSTTAARERAMRFAQDHLNWPVRRRPRFRARLLRWGLYVIPKHLSSAVP